MRNRIKYVKDYKYIDKTCVVENFGFNILLNVFSLIKISGYIDPGSATAIIGVLLGVMAGVGKTLKLYWYKIKEKISKSKIK